MCKATGLMHEDCSQLHSQDGPEAGIVAGARRPSWRPPVITRLTVERTLSGPRSGTDALTATESG
jgi:hypothetical protein